MRMYLTGPGAGSAEFYEEMTSFVEHHHPYEWTLETLKTTWIFDLTEDDGDLIGYFWFEPVSMLDVDALSIHGVVRPDWQGRWMTRNRLYAMGQEIVEASGIRAYVAHAPTLHLKKLWTGLGYTLAGDVAYYIVPE